MTNATASFGRFLYRIVPTFAPAAPVRRRRPRAEVLQRYRFGREPTRRYRAIWISDIHLGTRGAQTDMLLDFLRHTESDYLYLVGDIVDCWRLKRSWFWNEAHDRIVRTILDKARRGTRVVYVPGNHDEALRPYAGTTLADVRVEKEATHVTDDGRRLLILHGDEFDGVVRYAKWLAVLGDYAYTAALMLNTGLAHIRRLFGLPYWSLSAYLKYRVKNAVQFISRFEEIVTEEAERRGVDGVVCGHIHHAEIRRIGRIVYYNDGDWVESCTALVEQDGGRMELLHWATEIHKRVSMRYQKKVVEAVPAE